MTNTPIFPTHARLAAARDVITRLTDHDATCSRLDDPYRPDDDHDRALADHRYIMIDADLDPRHLISDAATIAALRDATATLIELAPIIDDARELLTRLALDHSLCPLHMIDYAICFDDDDDACATIRMIHPHHDT